MTLSAVAVQDSRPGEGMQAREISTRFFTGTMLVVNNEQSEHAVRVATSGESGWAAEIGLDNVARTAGCLRRPAGGSGFCETRDRRVGIGHRARLSAVRGGFTAPG